MGAWSRRIRGDQGVFMESIVAGSSNDRQRRSARQLASQKEMHHITPALTTALYMARPAGFIYSKGTMMVYANNSSCLLLSESHSRSLFRLDVRCDWSSLKRQSSFQLVLGCWRFCLDWHMSHSATDWCDQCRLGSRSCCAIGVFFVCWFSLCFNAIVRVFRSHSDVVSGH